MRHQRQISRILTASSLADLPDSLAAALRDRYLLKRQLGRGGMATVYLAQDLKHKREVALKVLDPEVGATLGPERFEREIQVAARLTHPHIVPVFDSGDTAGRLWYAMPFIAGESLRARLDRESRLPLPDALRITREVAEALDYAHRQGVIHRDVKPENILLAEGQASLADFGIARATAGTVAGQTLTATGFTLGTPAYMSPEQAGGAAHVDGRSDVYSLGCVLYEMLAGAAPFTGLTPQAVIASRFRGPPPPIEHARPDLPAQVAGIVPRALALEPAARFSTAGEFAAAVDAASTGAPGVGTAVGPTTPERSRLRMAVVLGIGLLAVLGVGVGWWRQRHAPMSPASNAPTLLAVLPFENQGRPEDEYFADGLADEVRGKLTQIPGLAVIARTSSGSYKRSPKPPQQIAHELGVRYLLTGTVRWEKPEKGADRVRVSAELLDVPERGQPTTKWQAPFEAPLTDVFQVQAEIAAKVADALNVQLRTHTREHLARAPTANLAAYQAYLQGVGDPGAGDLAIQEPDQLRRSIARLQQAVQLDSTFALAWAQLARAQANLAGYPVVTDRARLLVDAQRAAERAFALDSMLPTVRLAAAAVYDALNDPGRRDREIEAGLRFAPNDAALLSAKAFVGFDYDHPERALADLKHAEALDPRSSRIASQLYWVLSVAQRHTDAVVAADRVAALAPQSVEAAAMRVVARAASGDSAGAAALIATPAPGINLERYQLALLNYVDYLLPTPMLRGTLTLPDTLFENALDRVGNRAAVAARLGDSALTRIYADSLLRALDESQRATQAADTLPLMPLRAAAGYWLGQPKLVLKALAAFQRAGFARPDSLDFLALVGSYYAQFGVPDSAVKYLSAAVPLHRVPDWVVAGLRFDPNEVSTQKDPRFRPYFDQLTGGHASR